MKWIKLKIKSVQREKESWEKVSLREIPGTVPKFVSELEEAERS